jgi:hypothetical protein
VRRAPGGPTRGNVTVCDGTSVSPIGEHAFDSSRTKPSSQYGNHHGLGSPTNVIHEVIILQCTIVADIVEGDAPLVLLASTDPQGAVREVAKRIRFSRKSGPIQMLDANIG